MSRARLPEYRDTPACEVAWWFALWVLERGRLPTTAQVRERFGMSRASACRWHAWARGKLQQISAREGCHDASAI